MIHIVENAIDPSCTGELYQMLRQRAGVPHGMFWVKTEKIVQFERGDGEPVRELAEYLGEAAPLLYRCFSAMAGVARGLSRENLNEFEFWFSCTRRTSETVYLHIDTASTHRGTAVEQPHPEWGTILHLGPLEGLGGGSTVFCTEDPLSPAVAAHNQKILASVAAARSLSREWLEVPQKANRLIAFSGTLPHYVAPVTELPRDDQPRCALLVNFWRTAPAFEVLFKGICRLTPQEFKVFSRLPVRHTDLLRELALSMAPADLKQVTSALLRVAEGLEAAGGGARMLAAGDSPPPGAPGPGGSSS